jgi:uncharacterized membrane protein YhfC
MPATVHINPLYLASLIIAIIFVIAYPIVLAIIARKKLHVGWRYFWFGVLIFAIFQLLTRVPAVLILQSTVLAPLLRTSKTFAWIWLVILALTAGLFEEVGRYVAYRFFMRREEKTWNKAVMYGIGHGGLESALLVGGGLLIALINLIAYSFMNLNTLPLAAHTQIVNHINAINNRPAWMQLLQLLPVWERLWTVPIQVALSVLVLQVFRRQTIIWLFIAILAHFVVDFTSGALLQLFGSGATTSLIVEGVIAIFGLIALWVIWRLRDRESSPQQATAGEAVAPGA